MKKRRILAFDIEANGYKPSEIFCISATDLISGRQHFFDPSKIAEGCIFLSKSDLLVGHAIRQYDCPVIERLTDGLIKFKSSKLVDTLDMSKALSGFKKHSLKVWGDIFGIPKLDSPLFESYSPEMAPYCKRDVEITVKLFYHMVDLYIDKENKKTFRNAEGLKIFFEELLV